MQKKAISQPTKKKISKSVINNSSKSNSKKIDWREKYDDYSSFSEGLAIVKKNRKYGFINIEGDEIVSCFYDTANSFKEGLASVEKDTKWGYIHN
jgi:hypothetical protein